MPSKSRLKGLDDRKLDLLRDWYAQVKLNRTPLKISDIAFRLNTLGIKWYAPKIYHRTAYGGVKGIVNTASLMIGAATYYGESKSRIWALRRAIQNAVDDFEPIDGRCASGY